MSQLRSFVVASAGPMPKGNRGYLEPAAAGREAFWRGRPIAANPLIDGPAREWANGWKAARTELTAQSGQDVWTIGREERLRLLRTYRPVDVPKGTA